MLTFDLRDFERAALNFDAALREVPFALAQSMNDAVEEARRELIDVTWPRHVQVRNASFLNAALTTRGNRATKNNLRVAIEDRIDRANLFLHAEGGEKRPKGQAIAVPVDALAAKRRASGVPKGLRPRALPNSFKKGNKIYQRVGPKGRQIKPMYSLTSSATIKPDVPFDRDFERAMWLGISRAFGPRLRAAMASRRR